MEDNRKEIMIVYYSSTGFTKKYAEWLQLRLNSELCAASLCTIEEFAHKDISGYKALIFGSCLRAGKIKYLNKFMRKARKTDSLILVFCTGSMDYEDAVQSRVLEKNAKSARIPAKDIFYCPGGLGFERMKPIHKSMVEFYLNMLKKKHAGELSEEQRKRLDNISFDATDERYIEPIAAAALKTAGKVKSF